jgi:hypothetical protein
MDNRSCLKSPASKFVQPWDINAVLVETNFQLFFHIPYTYQTEEFILMKKCYSALLFTSTERASECHFGCVVRNILFKAISVEILLHILVCRINIKWFDFFNLTNVNNSFLMHHNLSHIILLCNSHLIIASFLKQH